MRLFSAIFALVALLPTFAISAPSIEFKTVTEHDSPKNPNSYIVKLRDNVSKADHLAWLDTNHNATAKVTYRNWQSDVFHGYAGT